ncbi:hypothetical protein O181_076000 [Austropuccinia psidii MF-1]|uniref:Uncharacterized protein n=1 Tax=Austropuccinia psidii MF-1 TaxID=1389203 RepID=A0A9Q3FFE1_9BASI|nr:hypothetical protein [Austropuccinia psidii MF-1]
MEPIVLQRHGQKINDWLKNQIILSVDQKKDFEMTPDLEKSPVVSNSSKKVPEVSKDKPKGPQKKQRDLKKIKEREKGKPIGTDLTSKGTGSPNWRLQLWTVFSILTELLWKSQPKNQTFPHNQ